MDIEDIDAWYEDRKNSLTEKYHEKIKKTDASFKIKPIEIDTEKQK